MVNTGFVFFKITQPLQLAWPRLMLTFYMITVTSLKFTYQNFHFETPSRFKLDAISQALEREMSRWIKFINSNTENRVLAQ